MPRSPVVERAGGSLGTFAGVFTPSILTILGIILFLRVGFVVGSAGLPRALLIVLMANAISVLTSISLSAIATNLRVKGGGDYYLISRTLGMEYGGALGLVLFLAQSISIAFYAIGFGEALGTVTGVEQPHFAQFVAAGAVALLFVLAWLGADVATRFQFVVMAVLFSALAAFFVGGISAASGAQLRANLEPASDVPFWALFAIFFPAVTGFTQGVSMSGDLRDPGKSLPRGTFAAVGASFVVYVAAALLFAASLSGSDLVTDYAAMRRVSAAAWLVDAGVIAATLSSAMASFLGAPRILQSLAADKVFPVLNPFAAGHGPTNNPRRGTLLAAGIAFATIALGNLNAIASVVSMFFLVSYGLLNYATYFEARANSPSFRPRFRFFSGRLSLAGAVGCLGAMLAISPTAGGIAVAVLFALHQYLSRSVRPERWADSERSHRLQRVRRDLHAIQSDLAHPRDWRPVLLAFSDNPARRERMLRFASWLEGGAGFTTLVRLLAEDGARARREREKTRAELETEIKTLGLQAFAKVLVSDDLERAVPVLLQSHGVGRVRANTVLLNWYDRRDDEDTPGLRAFPRYVRLALRFDCNVVVLAADAEDFSIIDAQQPTERRIDVWHRDDASGRLMLLLAYLMTRTPLFEQAKIRLLAPPRDDESSVEESERRIRQMLEDARIAAEPEVVATPGAEVVAEKSADASVVFLPLQRGGDLSSGTGEFEPIIERLPATALVLASQEIALDSEPETGPHGEVARAVDAASQARKAADKREKQARKAAAAAAAAGERVEAARKAGSGPAEIAELEEAARQAQKEAESLRRRAARTRAKAAAAVREAAELTGDDGEE